MTSNLTVNIEDFLQYYNPNTTVGNKSDVVNHLGLSLEVTKRGLYNMKTRAGVLKNLSSRKLHDVLAGAQVNYVDDKVLADYVANLVDKNKKNLPVNLH
jgi:hypothetical protein